LFVFISWKKEIQLFLIIFPFKIKPICTREFGYVSECRIQIRILIRRLSEYGSKTDPDLKPWPRLLRLEWYRSDQLSIFDIKCDLSWTSLQLEALGRSGGTSCFLELPSEYRWCFLLPLPQPGKLEKRACRAGTLSFSLVLTNVSASIALYKKIHCYLFPILGLLLHCCMILYAQAFW